MPDTILYTVGNGLYVNLTNGCTNDCDFCERNSQSGVGSAGSLWLDAEPSAAGVIAALRLYELTQYDELVFCGFGEPTLRMDVLLTVARAVKAQCPGLPVRINTNGHANLIAGRDVTPGMAGLIDRLSVSLNRPDAGRYNAHMRSVFGLDAFSGLLDFTRRAAAVVPQVTLTALDDLPPEEMETCRKIALDLGVGFRVRERH